MSDQNESTQQTPPPPPFTPSERALKLHDEYRNKLWNDLLSGSENFDKYLITFSTGALALSLSFIKDTVPLKDAIWIPVLVVSWVLFILAALVTLISFRFSLSSLERTFPLINEYYLNGKPDALDKHLGDVRTKAVEWCAWAGLILFVLGLICTMMFVTVNVTRSNGTPEKDTPSQDNSVHIDRIDACCEPMKQIMQNTKPETHGKDKVEKGVKPPPMPPVPIPPPQPCPAPPPKK